MNPRFRLPPFLPARGVAAGRHFFPSGSALAGLLALAACLAVGLGSYRLLAVWQLDQLAHTNAQRLGAYAVSLENALARHETLPFVLSQDHRLHELLDHPADPARVDTVNRYLELVQGRAGVTAAYLIDAAGLTLAASNWATPQSFLGQHYTFRPYFREAMEGRPGRFYGVGATTGDPGYFISAPVQEAGTIRGVVVVKVSLSAFEAAWRESGDALNLADAHGVLFLASLPDWRYRSLAPLGAAVEAELRETRQYGPYPLLPVKASEALSFDSPARPITLWDNAGGRRDALMQTLPVGPLGWRLVLFSDLAGAYGLAAARATALGFATAFLLALGFFAWQRHSRLQERRAARAELARAHAELEAKVAERTALLTATNVRLEEQLDAQAEAERILRATQDRALQAGRLAALGQMAAGITHELNQPLAALNTLSDNAVAFLQRGKPEGAVENLRLISQLAGRMGRIVGELKAFARRGQDELVPVSVREALDHALFIVELRRRELDAAITLAVPDPAPRVLADPVRLEQVLVNLLRNGLDALADLPAEGDGAGGAPRIPRRLAVTVARVPAYRDAADEGAPGQVSASLVRIVIADQGPGIPAEVLPRLFEPFFTTKPAGEGLGLGLSISLTIAESFGGTLAARNRSEGGAEFILELPAA